jgi:Fe-S cluster biosynthesis and repair protein YggX
LEDGSVRSRGGHIATGNRRYFAVLHVDLDTMSIHCIRYGSDQEPLARAPVPGELGQRILANVGKKAWSEWLAHQTMLINENRLSPLDPKARAFLAAELEKYFFGDGSAKPSGYVSVG